MSDEDAAGRADELVEELSELVGDTAVARRALSDLRTGLVAPLDPDLTARHLDAMVAAAGDGSGTTGGEVVDLRGRRVRRAVTGTAIGVLALAGTGGLAAAGQLPGPVQDTVSRVAGFVSIDIPRSTPATGVDAPAVVEVPTTPGSTAPGLSVDDHPRSSAPGQSGTSPSDTAPGQTGTSPSDTAPGQSGTSPSDTAPGQTGTSPSDTAPGQTGTSPSDTAPGQSGTSPSDTAPGQGQGQGSTNQGQGQAQNQGQGQNQGQNQGQGQGGGSGVR